MSQWNAKFGQVSALLQQGKVEQAVASLRRLAQKAPGDWEVNTALGSVLVQSGQAEQGLFFLRKAAEGKRGDAGVWVTLGRALADLGKWDGALEAYRSGVAAQPGQGAGWSALVNHLYTAHRLNEALGACRDGLEATGWSPEVAATYAFALQNMARAGEAERVLAGAVERHPASYTLRTARAVVSNYVEGMTPEEIFRVHRECGEVLEKVMARGDAGPSPEGGAEKKKLRVGFVSPDFRTHSVAFFVEPLLERLDRERVETVCIDTWGKPDAVTERLKKLAGEWRGYGGPREEEFAAFLRGLKLDVLVELTGHFEWNRLPALHLRPAPVIASYCGYPNTTGLGAVGYRIVDGWTDPPGVSDGLAVEKLVRLGRCFLCYRPAPGLPGTGGGAPSERAGFVTFGSFNALQKLNDGLIGLWARVLGTVPGSRLVLKNFGFKDAGVREEIAGRFAAAGVGAGRLVLMEPSGGIAEHLAEYSRIDIALDTFPYHGTTTTCEALVMGVPVVTLVGRAHASRVGLSLLTAVGRAGWAAADADSYVRICTELAADSAGRGVARAGLRGEVLGSSLCDESAHARAFETALRGMWRERCGAGGG